MNYLPLRIWFIVTLTLALGAAIASLSWVATAYIDTTPSLTIIFLLIFVTSTIYALFLYLAIKPSFKKLKSLPVRIWVSIIFTAAIISTIIHYIRFVPSPEAAETLSVVIASLLLTAGISGYLLILWVIWFMRAKKGD